MPCFWRKLWQIINPIFMNLLTLLSEQPSGWEYRTMAGRAEKEVGESEVPSGGGRGGGLLFIPSSLFSPLSSYFLSHHCRQESLFTGRHSWFVVCHSQV